MARVGRALCCSAAGSEYAHCDEKTTVLDSDPVPTAGQGASPKRSGRWSPGLDEALPTPSAARSWPFQPNAGSEQAPSPREFNNTWRLLIPRCVWVWAGRFSSRSWSCLREATVVPLVLASGKGCSSCLFSRIVARSRCGPTETQVRGRWTNRWIARWISLWITWRVGHARVSPVRAGESSRSGDVRPANPCPATLRLLFHVKRNCAAPHQRSP